MTAPLFPTLPLAPRPPRRLRRLGFQLEQLQRAAEFGDAVRRRIDNVEVRLAALVAKITADGRMPPTETYRLVIKNEEQREELEDSLRRIDKAQRALEQELAEGIERHLARCAKCT